MSNKPIGFIGLGNMGGRIARRLVAAGYDVLGSDSMPGRAEACGATAATSLADVAEQAEVILLSLPDSHVVEAVVEGAGGLLANARPGQVVVDLSTAAASSTIRLGQRFAEHRVTYIDAGISGGAAAAEKGTLTLMVGGEEGAIRQLEKLFAAFSTKVAYMGPSGAGHTTKLLNNFLNAGSLAASAEVMVAGKPPDEVRQICDRIQSLTSNLADELG